MNFILFTNQGSPLQNSSLGQLHSDGGVVSIVRSSAGTLLLVYLPARRLRSSGYYPKYQNGALSSGFWTGGIKRSHRDWDPANRGVEEPQECFLCPQFIDGDCRVTLGVVVVQHPSACNAWSHMVHPFPEFFKDFPIKSLIDSLSWWHKFLVDDTPTVKKTNEVNSSNPGHNNRPLNKVFSLSSVSTRKFGQLTQIRSIPLPSQSFPINYSLIIEIIDVSVTEIVVK